MPKTDEIKMPGVVTFHFETGVMGDGDSVIIQADLPDWDPEEVVVKRLAREYGVGTMGELAAAMLEDGRARVDPDKMCRWKSSDKV